MAITTLTYQKVFTKAMVILSSACDKAIIETELPCLYVAAFAPNQQPLSITFDATYDTGVQYVLDNFGLEPEIVNTR